MAKAELQNEIKQLQDDLNKIDLSTLDKEQISCLTYLRKDLDDLLLLSEIYNDYDTEELLQSKSSAVEQIQNIKQTLQHDGFIK